MRERFPQTTVLVVDDNQAGLYTTSKILKDEHLNVIQACTGKEAIQMAKEFLPDVIVLDVQLPDINGFEVCNIIKGDPDTSSIPIIHLSATYLDADSMVRGLEGGADSYLTHPVEPPVLIATIISVLRIYLAESEIKKMNKSLKELNATKDKLLTIVAHDLRGPFSGFVGLSKSLTDNIENLSKDEISEYCSAIFATSQKLFNFLNNILEWAQLESDKIVIKPVRLNLKEEVESIKELFNSSLSGKSIRLLNEINPNNFIFTDKNIISIILRNLLSNAVKFTPEGGSVTISSKIGDGFISVSVKDTGIGMDADAVNKLFKIESTIKSNGTNGEEGSGFGLILCNELIEKIGGKIIVESIPNKGSTFTFTIPTSESA